MEDAVTQRRGVVRMIAERWKAAVVGEPQDRVTDARWRSNVLDSLG